MRSTATATATARTDYGQIKRGKYYPPIHIEESWDDHFQMGMLDSGTYTIPSLWEEEYFSVNSRDIDPLKKALRDLEKTVAGCTEEEDSWLADLDESPIERAERVFFHRLGVAVGTKQGYTPF